MLENILQNKKKNKKRFFKKMPPFLSFVFDVIKLVVLAFIIVWPIHRFVFQPFYVVGPSMEPSFYDNEYLIIEKITYRFREPKRGEVIVFQSPSNPKDYLIKRIIGLPNEKILIEKGGILIENTQFVRGLKLKEDTYLASGTTTPGQISVELQDDQYYVLGDNRNMSLDSRVFGPISRENINGRTWFRGWPFKEIGLIEMPIFIY
ncbi:signal peptidase I [Patescibacteria group bacterium]|nr:signal peptidase I [Patescibacteria group bacterium]